MALTMTFAVQTSYAYDTSGRRDPERDDWLVEDVGELSEDVVPEFVAARYPKAIRVLQIDSTVI